jgi:uncharacterized membrane protein YhaH (DUF805 family)
LVIDYLLENSGELTGIFSLATLIPSIAISVRRLHDVGKQGPYLLYGLVPFIGNIILLVQFVKNSQPGENEYGPATK